MKPNSEKLADYGRMARLFAARGPAYYYLYGRWRLLNWRQRMSTGAFNPDDTALLQALDSTIPALHHVKAAAWAGRRHTALAGLADYFRSRTEPRFFFNYEDKPALLALIPDDQRAATLRAADEVCRNLFTFRGVGPIQFDAYIDWTFCPNGNIDWTWDLNRHAYFEALGRAYWYTGDERYAEKFRQLVVDWLARNPIGIDRPGWRSPFEVAFRSTMWTWAFHYFRSSPVFDDKTCRLFLKSLLAHGRYLDRNLELHVPNNHLLLEAKALAWLGLLFPEFKEAKRWRRRGLNLLYREVRAQVGPDGVHGEQSTHYQRVIAGELLELLVLLENHRQPLAADIIAAFSRMVEFELWVTKPNGQAPLLSDAALTDTHLRFSAASAGPVFLGRDDLRANAPPLDAAGIWLLGAQRINLPPLRPLRSRPLGSRAFPAGGYFVMRTGGDAEAAYLVFDCGPFGYAPVPGHGHADALSFELHAGGQTLLADPGIYSASLGREWRNFFRGSRAHNTVVVDDQDQSLLLDTRRVYRPASATLHAWRVDDRYDFVDGSHDGYLRLPEPITHRRQIFFAKPEYWIMIDELTGHGRHTFDLYFHLLPDAEPCLYADSQAVWIGNGHQPGLGIVPLATADLQAEIITGATEPIQGWMSFDSGEKQPAPALRYRWVGQAPVQFCTVLYPYPAGGHAPVTVSPLNVRVDGQPAAGESWLTRMCIETGLHRDVLVIDRGQAASRKSFEGYETSARMVYLRYRKGDDRPLIAIAHGSEQNGEWSPALSVDGDEAIALKDYLVLPTLVESGTRINADEHGSA
ncbi:MAG TPA: alginate lyase family protein [Anaerolineae bacterium]|nr:alginate lyase family protein [Anaerolineae bacterium]